MKKQYLVQTFGYWGRGGTIHSAAVACLQAGASKRDRCTVELFTHPTEFPQPEVTGGGMNISYREGSTKESIVKSAEKFTLGKVLRDNA